MGLVVMPKEIEHNVRVVEEDKSQRKNILMPYMYKSMACPYLEFIFTFDHLISKT